MTVAARHGTILKKALVAYLNQEDGTMNNKKEWREKRKSPSGGGCLTDGRMEDKRNIRKYIEKMLNDASEQELRLILIATQGILKK